MLQIDVSKHGCFSCLTAISIYLGSITSKCLSWPLLFSGYEPFCCFSVQSSNTKQFIVTEQPICTSLSTIQAWLQDQEDDLNSDIGPLSIVSVTHNVTVT